MPAPDGPVAVTGAGGYLGGRVAVALGERALAVVRAPVPWLPERRQVACDLLGPAASVGGAVDGAPAVVHLAGHNEVVAAGDPDRAIAETVAMAEAVVAAAQATGAARLVYVSTVHVYGEHLQPGAHVDEDVAPAPTSAYAAARWACEQVVAASGLDAVVLRLTNAVGAPADPTVDRWTLVASDLCRGAVVDGTMVLRSAGLQWRDFIPLDDVSRIVVAATDPAAVPAGTYNLAAGRSTTVRALAELVQDRVELACGRRPHLEAPPAEGRPDAPYVVDPGRLGASGLRSTLALEDALDEIIEHCRKHDDVLRAGRTHP